MNYFNNHHRIIINKINNLLTKFRLFSSCINVVFQLLIKRNRCIRTSSLEFIIKVTV